MKLTAAISFSKTMLCRVNYVKVTDMSKVQNLRGNTKVYGSSAQKGVTLSYSYYLLTNSCNFHYT
jgi:hypothetical protein